VLHVVEVEVDEKYNGEVRFLISLFIKKLQAFTSSILQAAILDSRGNVIHACNFFRNEDIHKRTSPLCFPSTSNPTTCITLPHSHIKVFDLNPIWPPTKWRPSRSPHLMTSPSA
jgi:hypothetical protein